MTAVPVDTRGSAFRQGLPTTLFEVPLAGSDVPLYGNDYDVSPDGESFLLISPDRLAIAAPIIVVVNWTEDLAR